MGSHCQILSRGLLWSHYDCWVEKRMKGDASGDVGRGREAREEAVGIILKRDGAGGQRYINSQ